MQMWVDILYVKKINLCNLALLRQLKVDQDLNNVCSSSDPIIPRFIMV